MLPLQCAVYGARVRLQGRLRGKREEVCTCLRGMQPGACCSMCRVGPRRNFVDVTPRLWRMLLPAVQVMDYGPSARAVLERLVARGGQEGWLSSA